MQPVKNKGVTYLLIAAVAVVWGIIIYRVLFTDPPSEQDFVAGPTPVHEPFDEYIAKEDTLRLSLNYRDPFLTNANANAAAAAEATATMAPVPHAAQPMKPIAPPVNWGAIKYTGYITNPKTKKQVSILTVNGKERMVAEGESLEGVKLLKNKRDSVLLSWMGKQKYIKQ
ncbi:hypothetical protein SAMN06265348_103276 [Pedobacter westerhofensis]|uniref:Type IV pilus biogenesis n=1 Tax=Pedobacter westerhofensis TaxID=425512 RepID=A0A521C6Y4_9SPHI|nr:hypothetical protein [Pedobacter westerhofensis]SMO55125.1 hypothetical protein SAMN06265348_103276 [Pedobacter westerhofensis]